MTAIASARGTVAASGLALAILLALGGCSSAERTPVSHLKGMSAPAATTLVPDGHEFVWYNLSQFVLHKDLAISDPQGDGAVVIAVCSTGDTIEDSSKIAAGVIPRSEYSSALRAAAEKNAYRELLPECAQQ